MAEDISELESKTCSGFTGLHRSTQWQRIIGSHQGIGWIQGPLQRPTYLQRRSTCIYSLSFWKSVNTVYKTGFKNRKLGTRYTYSQM